jgi:hypothetical protein
MKIILILLLLSDFSIQYCYFMYFFIKTMEFGTIKDERAWWCICDHLFDTNLKKNEEEEEKNFFNINEKKRDNFLREEWKDGISELFNFFFVKAEIIIQHLYRYINNDWINLYFNYLLNNGYIFKFFLFFINFIVYFWFLKIYFFFIFFHRIKFQINNTWFLIFFYKIKLQTNNMWFLFIFHMLYPFFFYFFNFVIFNIIIYIIYLYVKFFFFL